MLSLSFCAGMLGIEGYVVRVEADSSAGTPAFTIIGLPDRALGEARDRVRAAIFNSGFAYPAGKLLVNLSPADVRKEGPAFDLAIALGLLAIDEQIDRLGLQNFIALGELALDGTLRPVSGILPMVLGARNAGFAKFIVPERNAEEASLVDGVELYAVDSLQAAVAVVLGNGGKWRTRTRVSELQPADELVHGDLADVRGRSGVQGGRPGVRRANTQNRQHEHYKSGSPTTRARWQRNLPLVLTWIKLKQPARSVVAFLLKRARESQEVGPSLDADHLPALK